MMSKQSIITGTIALMIVLSITILSFYYEDNLDQKITGRQTTARATILETTPANCTFYLDQGLNLVSFNCMPSSTLLNESLKNTAGNNLSIYAMYTYGQESPNHWVVYNPNLPNWTIQGLQTLDRRTGYVLIMNQADTMFQYGFDFPTTNIDLAQGWNIIGYPTNNSRNITEALQIIQDNVTIVATYQIRTETKEWLIYEPGIQDQIEIMRPGESYWIYANENVRWNVTW